VKSFQALVFYPLALLYGFVIFIRNWMFTQGIKKEVSFPTPIISVGNLSVGGTGKTPHIEFLVRLLKYNYKVATLSRGYGRKSSGFLLANNKSTHFDVGDEPLQYFSKFGSVIDVAVDEKRVHGVEKLLDVNFPPEVILLDDAFQHRYIKPGLSILLTDFHNLYCNDYILPSGSLREFRAGAKRADIIIVTKTGKTLSPITRSTVIDNIKPKPHQKVFFSHIVYDELVPLLDEEHPKDILKETSMILLFAGIANPYPLENQLRKSCSILQTIKFKDHHQYSDSDIKSIKKEFEDVFSSKKIIVTTEKDAMRITSAQKEILAGLPIFFIPIRIKFHDNDGLVFNKDIMSYVKAATDNKGR